MLILGIALDTKSISTFQGLIELMKQKQADTSELITIAVHHTRYNLQDRIFRDKFLEVIEQYYSSNVDVSAITIHEKSMN